MGVAGWVFAAVGTICQYNFSPSSTNYFTRFLSRSETLHFAALTVLLILLGGETMSVPRVKLAITVCTLLCGHGALQIALIGATAPYCAWWANYVKIGVYSATMAAALLALCTAKTSGRVSEALFACLVVLPVPVGITAGTVSALYYKLALRRFRHHLATTLLGSDDTDEEAESLLASPADAELAVRQQCDHQQEDQQRRHTVESIMERASGLLLSAIEASPQSAELEVLFCLLNIERAPGNRTLAVHMKRATRLYTPFVGVMILSRRLEEYRHLLLLRSNCDQEVTEVHKKVEMHVQAMRKHTRAFWSALQHRSLPDLCEAALLASRAEQLALVACARMRRGSPRSPLPYRALALVGEAANDVALARKYGALADALEHTVTEALDAKSEAETHHKAEYRSAFSVVHKSIRVAAVVNVLLALSTITAVFAICFFQIEKCQTALMSLKDASSLRAMVPSTALCIENYLADCGTPSAATDLADLGYFGRELERLSNSLYQESSDGHGISLRLWRDQVLNVSAWDAQLNVHLYTNTSRHRAVCEYKRRAVSLASGGAENCTNVACSGAAREAIASSQDARYIVDNAVSVMQDAMDDLVFFYADAAHANLDLARMVLEILVPVTFLLVTFPWCIVVALTFGVNYKEIQSIVQLLLKIPDRVIQKLADWPSDTMAGSTGGGATDQRRHNRLYPGFSFKLYARFLLSVLLLVSVVACMCGFALVSVRYTRDGVNSVHTHIGRRSLFRYCHLVAAALTAGDPHTYGGGPALTRCAAQLGEGNVPAEEAAGRFPQLRALLSERDCTGAAPGSGYCRGLDDLDTIFVRRATVLADTYLAEATPDTEDYAVLHVIEPSFLFPWHTEAEAIIVRAVHDRLAWRQRVLAALYAVCAVAAVAAYFLMRSILVQLGVEKNYFIEMIHRLPADAVESSPEVKEFLYTGNFSSTRFKKETVKRLLMSCHDAVVSFRERTGDVLLFNRAAEAMFGYTEAEASTLLFGSFLVSDWRVAANGGGSSSGDGRLAEVTAKHKDGTCFPVVMSLGHPVDLAGNGDFAITAFIRDISGVASYQELATLNQKLQQLVPAETDVAPTVHENMSVLFAEILTNVSAWVDDAPASALRMVGHLHNVVCVWDKLVRNFDAEKILHTGSLYVCACGLSSRRDNAAEALSHCADELLSSLAQYDVENADARLHARCAVASGPVVAAVLGDDSRPARDLFGPAVYEAARALATCRPDRVKVVRVHLDRSVSYDTASSSPKVVASVLADVALNHESSLWLMQSKSLRTHYLNQVLRRPAAGEAAVSVPSSPPAGERLDQAPASRSMSMMMMVHGQGGVAAGGLASVSGSNVNSFVRHANSFYGGGSALNRTGSRSNNSSFVLAGGVHCKVAGTMAMNSTLQQSLVVDDSDSDSTSSTVTSW
eukprot:TRINITY_DN3446_c0_g2_i7.p1 TRINITY_DN3446_c0_g2~~TRINITY_DN3446_c0_g2_i7.p1  ORF type:complete len:1409 (-),score=322.87 TRINITY_DN3446_c0_g2_i7:45-4271(-)